MHSIIGKSVILTPISDEDTKLILQWRNSADVQQNFVFRERLTREMHESWLKTKVATGDVIQFVISKKSDGVKIGSVYLRDIDREHKHAEFGIFIGDCNARGKGYGSEAASLICQYGFLSLGLHRIYLRVFTSNTAAIKCYEKVGFSKEGVARDIAFLDGRYHDMVFMSLLSCETTDGAKEPDPCWLDEGTEVGARNGSIE